MTTNAVAEISSERYVRLKAILDECWKKTNRELQALKDLDRDARRSGGRESRKPEDGDDEMQKSVRFGLIELKTGNLKKIEAAQERLERGIYGICLACEGEIPEKQMEVTPFRLRCIPCEEAKEIQDAERNRKRPLGGYRKRL